MYSSILLLLQLPFFVADLFYRCIDAICLVFLMNEDVVTQNKLNKL